MQSPLCVLFKLKKEAGVSPEGEEALDINNILQSIPTTGLVSGGEWTGVPFKTILSVLAFKGAVSVALHGWDEGKPDPVTQYLSVGRTDFDVVDPGIINYQGNADRKSPS